MQHHKQDDFDDAKQQNHVATEATIQEKKKSKA